MTEKKSILPLKWIIAGFAFLITYIFVVVKVAIFVYQSYGILATVATVVAISVVFKVLVSPRIIKYLNRQKSAAI